MKKLNNNLFFKVKPRGGAPLAAVEDLDREGGYAVPKDNVTPGSKVN